MLSEWEFIEEQDEIQEGFAADEFHPNGEGAWYQIQEFEDEFSLANIPAAILTPLRKGLEKTAVRAAVTLGYRDENTLTNLVFWARHPERWGRKLQKSEPDFKPLSREWLDIRNRLVRPILRSPPGTGQRPSPPTSGPCAVSGSCMRCGTCSACERRLRSAPTPRLQTVPRDLRYSSRRSITLDAQALAAYRRLVQAARADGIRAPYLKIHSGHRDYDRQARLWRGRLLSLFTRRGCSSSQQRCIAAAIDRTTQALRSTPVPHSRDAWTDRFVQELNRTGCALSCNPRLVVRQLRRGTAPPGRSPHHTGRAVDIHVGGRISTAARNVQFQRRQAAFQWLVCNAARFGFYPYNHEPWHWEYNPA